MWYKCSSLPEVRELGSEVDLEVQASKVLVLVGVAYYVNLELGYRNSSNSLFTESIVESGHTARNFLR